MDHIGPSFNILKWLWDRPPVRLVYPQCSICGLLAGTFSALAGFLFYRIVLPSLADQRAFWELEAWVATLGQGLAGWQLVWAVVIGSLGGALLGSVHPLKRAVAGPQWPRIVQALAVIIAALIVPLIQITTGGTSDRLRIPPFAPNYAAFGGVTMALLLALTDLRDFQPFRAVLLGSFLPSAGGSVAFILVGLITCWGGIAPALLLAATASVSLVVYFTFLYLGAKASEPRRRAGFNQSPLT